LETIDRELSKSGKGYEKNDEEEHLEKRVHVRKNFSLFPQGKQLGAGRRNGILENCFTPDVKE